MLTDRQLSRLPYVFQEIVTNQRALEEYCCGDLVSIDHFKTLRDRRSALATTAAREWQPRITRGSPSFA